MKILVPKIYVTKLIGARGCMIQEISMASGGASIKILSDKRSEQESQNPDIIVQIAGSLKSIIDGSYKILEHLESFKSGGPVFNSGRTIHNNIFNQFNHTIILSGIDEEAIRNTRKQNQEEKEKIDEDFYSSGENQIGDFMSDAFERSVSKDRRHRFNEGNRLKSRDQEDSIDRDRRRAQDKSNNEFYNMNKGFRDHKNDNYRGQYNRGNDDNIPIHAKDHDYDRYKHKDSHNNQRLYHSPRERQERSYNRGYIHSKERGMREENYRHQDRNQDYMNYPKRQPMQLGPISRSRSNSRSRSRSRHRSISLSRDRHRKFNNESNIRDIPRDNRDPRDLRDMKFQSENKIINTDILVPNRLVPILIGKNGDSIRSIIDRSGANVIFNRKNVQ